jgi:hypothetical protein
MSRRMIFKRGLSPKVKEDSFQKRLIVEKPKMVEKEN